MQLHRPKRRDFVVFEHFLLWNFLLCPGIFCIGISCAEGVSSAEGAALERPWKYSLPLQIGRFSAVLGSVIWSAIGGVTCERWLAALFIFVLTSLQFLVMWEGDWGGGWIHSFHPFSNVSQALALGAWLVQPVLFVRRLGDTAEIRLGWVDALWSFVFACTTVLALYGPSQA